MSPNLSSVVLPITASSRRRPARAALLALLLPLSFAAHAQSEAELLKCLGIADAGARLACFDQSARALKAARATTPALPSAAARPAPAAPAVAIAPTGAPTAAPTAPAAAEDNFGRNKPVATPQELHSHIVGGFSGWRQGERVKLANGQVWQLLDNGTYIDELKDPKVVIRPGAMGATYFMTVEGLRMQIRTRRVTP